MTARRSPSFDLGAALLEPSFTPRASDLPAVLDRLLGDDQAEAAAERAVLRLGAAAAPAVEARLVASPPPLRGRLARLLGKLALDEQALVPRVLALLDDADPKTSRNAILALGRLPSPAVEARLVELVHRPPAAGHLRSAVDALGRIGGAPALAALRALVPGDDAELARLRNQALLRLERTLGRDTPSEIDLDAAPSRPVAIELTCRPGLEGLLADEVGGRAEGPGRVAATLATSLAKLFRARLFIDVTFPLEPGRGGNDPVASIVTALTSPQATALLRPLTRGAIRYRIAWAEGGHRRADILRIATGVAAARPDLVNDPTASTWEARVLLRSAVKVSLVPRRFTDPRFSYRKRDVPAASHPTVAAALARVAGARPDDVVWDPFVGSGVELIERARLGPYRALHGGDLDENALEAAAENLAAAGVTATLVRRDARAGAPPGTTLILTNPPMGHRVLGIGEIPRLLEAMVAIAGRSLPAGGRLVWLSPFAAATAEAARRAGLTVVRRQPVDLGGIPAELQLLRR